MKREDLEFVREKRIKLFLKNNIFYSGIIQNIHEDSFIFLDKFSNTIIINIDSV